MSDTLVIIPAFNEEKNIANVIERLTNTLNDVDYVIVNDGSIDSTSKICRERGFNIIDLPVNLGLAGIYTDNEKKM